MCLLTTGTSSLSPVVRYWIPATGHFQLTCLWQGQGVRDRAGARGIRTKLVSDAVDLPAVRMLITGYWI
jgi:hypothetical protein